jgi:transcriptional regulator with XRE-family HTH domain
MPRITQLKRMIVGRRLIQADIAEISGISEYRLSRIVNGRIEPKDYELKNLAKALGVKQTELPI